MNEYQVIELKDGRVILEPARPLKDDAEHLVQSIEAETWLDARFKVEESALYHDFGKGWFRR